MRELLALFALLPCALAQTALSAGLTLTDGVTYVCPPALATPGCYVTLSVTGGGGGSGTAGAGGIGGAVTATFLLGALNPTLTSILSVTGNPGVTSFSGGGGAASAVYSGTTLLAVAGGGGGAGYNSAGPANGAGGAGGITSPLFPGTAGVSSGGPTGGGGGTSTAPGAGGPGSGGGTINGQAGTGGGSFGSPGVGGSCPTGAGCTTASGGGVAGNGLVYAANGGSGCTAGGSRASGGGGGGFYGGGSGGASNSNIGAWCRCERIWRCGPQLACRVPCPHHLPYSSTLFFPSCSRRRRRLELGHVCLCADRGCNGHNAYHWAARVHGFRGCSEGRLRLGLLPLARGDLFELRACVALPGRVAIALSCALIHQYSLGDGHVDAVARVFPHAVANRRVPCG